MDFDIAASAILWTTMAMIWPHCPNVILLHLLAWKCLKMPDLYGS